MGINIGAGIGSAGIGSAGIGTAGISIDPSGPSYTGPLDLVPGAAVGISAVRAPSSDLLGEPGYTLKKLDGDTEPTQAFSYAAVDPGTVNSATIATFLDGEDGETIAITNGSTNARDFSVIGGQVGMYWGAGSGTPQFTLSTTKNMSATLIPMAAGARTYVFVLNYTENENGNSILKHHEAGSPELIFGAYWNNANDIYVEASYEAEEVRFVTDATALTTGRHIVELQFDAAGILTVLVDGVEKPCSVDGGAAFSLPAVVASEFLIGSGSNTDPCGVCEFYAWPQEDMGATARLNIQQACNTPALS